MQLSKKSNLCAQENGRKDTCSFSTQRVWLSVARKQMAKSNILANAHSEKENVVLLCMHEKQF